MKAIFDRIKMLDSHHRLFTALAAAILVALGTAGRVRLPVQAVLTWNAYAFTTLFLAWVRIVAAEPTKSLRQSELQDSSKTIISVIVVVSAFASLFAVGMLLGMASGLNTRMITEHVFLAILTVAGSWTLVHTVFALHYARLYYRSPSETTRAAQAGGLIFPGEKHPDYLDFAYFSFVVGMTCQVSDVQVTGRNLRRLVFLHGLLAFAYNTAIVALSINLASSLFAK